MRPRSSSKARQPATSGVTKRSMGLRRPNTSSGRGSNQVWGQIAKGNVALIAGALLGVSYAAVRLSYEEFYAWLGATPADVGFQPVDALGRAALGLALILAAAVLGGVLAVFLGWLVVSVAHWALLIVSRLAGRKRPSPPRLLLKSALNAAGPRTRSSWILPVLAVLPLMAILLVVFQQASLGNEPSIGLWFAGFFLVFIFPMYIAWAMRTFRKWLIGRGLGAFGAMFLLALTFLTAVAALYIFADLGRNEARYLREYGQQPSGGVSAVSLFGYRGECATVNPSIVGLPDQPAVIYLGRAEGSIFVFDVVMNRSIRYPVTQAVVTGSNDAVCAWSAFARNKINTWKSEGVDSALSVDKLIEAGVPEEIAIQVAARLMP